MHAGTKLDLSWEETLSKFKNVLAGSYKAAWHEVLVDNLSTPTQSDTIDDQNCGFDCDKLGFCWAIDLFTCTILNSKVSWDLQYIYIGRQPLDYKRSFNAAAWAHKVI